MVTAIIPTWNRRDLLEAVLADLAAQTPPIEKIIVIDNGSTDGSSELARARGAHVIRWHENRGFARAVNAGMQAATTPWILILNNDVQLPPDWLAAMLETAAKHPESQFFVSKLAQAGNAVELDGAFDALSRSGFAWRCGAGRPDGPIWSVPQAIQFAPLTAALVRRDLFEKIGPLNEQFESYYEDVDFFLRCGLAGVTGWYQPNAVARHVGSATLGGWNKDTVFRLTRNHRYLIRIYFHELPARPVLVGQLLWMLLCVRHGRGLAWIRGWLAGGRVIESRTMQVAHAKIAQIVNDGDNTILDLQKATGFDWFWKTYFRWAG